ncbi:HIT family protein [Kitasatospora purpeofusca]|uniref:HIT family protein n=1 Tax=Kitasatospora purpeofusca TaxID=67352 RepID=UPI002257C669|nr:HIT family protein [Kitasatospora purpeofusca]MCX4690752.1 HIT family protein [Kitasatospora purpeofusca]WSR46013.1 HIT family protein [Kitasatospora purpeofusca]
MSATTAKDVVGGGGCVFCAISAGLAPAQVVRRWPETIAIVPLEPVTDGHVIVLPTRHVPDAALEPVVTGLTMRRAAELAQRAGAANLITSIGAEATQTVPHLHIHLVPRRAHDGLALPWTTTGSAPAGGLVAVGDDPTGARIGEA